MKWSSNDTNCVQKHSNCKAVKTYIFQRKSQLDLRIKYGSFRQLVDGQRNYVRVDQLRPGSENIARNHFILSLMDSSNRKPQPPVRIFGGLLFAGFSEYEYLLGPGQQVAQGGVM